MNKTAVKSNEQAAQLAAATQAARARFQNGEDQDDETFAAHPSLTPIPFTPAGHDEVIAIFQNHGFK